MCTIFATFYVCNENLHCKHTKCGKYCSYLQNVYNIYHFLCLYNVIFILQIQCKHIKALKKNHYCGFNFKVFQAFLLKWKSISSVCVYYMWWLIPKVWGLWTKGLNLLVFWVGFIPLGEAQETVLQVFDGVKERFEPLTLLILAQSRWWLCSRPIFLESVQDFLIPKCLFPHHSCGSLSRFFQPLSHTLLPPFIAFL